MASARVKFTEVAGEPALASREGFKARGTEHSFSLK